MLAVPQYWPEAADHASSGIWLPAGWFDSISGTGWPMRSKVERPGRFVPLFSAWLAIGYRLLRGFTFAGYFGLLVAFLGVRPVQAEAASAQGVISFDIPAQPLADALNAYGAATGLEVFVDASVANGRRASAVKGIFPPKVALGMLLSGTGCVPKMTGPDIISIVTAPTPPAHPPDINASHQYDPYLAVLQTRLAQALCSADRPPADGDEIICQFWVSALGTITHAEIIGGNADQMRKRALVAGMEGLAIGEPPPADMPEPVTMAIYPPMAGEASGCPGAQ